jgi:hypothetical protein
MKLIAQFWHNGGKDGIGCVIHIPGFFVLNGNFILHAPLRAKTQNTQHPTE